LTELQAIDTYVNPRTEEWIRALGERAGQMDAYFGTDTKPVSFSELADRYRRRQMMAVIVNADAETASGIPPVPNDLIAEAVKAHPDVFLGYGGIDPWKGKAAINELRRCRRELDLKGLKFHPGRQAFFPNDPRFYPIWEAAEEEGLVLLFHTGMMGGGARRPGGMGFKLKYTNPIYLDDIAADLPELTVIASHPSWPWQEESLAMARHKSNVFIDLSGWAPKYFPESLVHYAKHLIQDQVLFGSDWPVIPLERWLEEFDALGFEPDVKRKVMLENACRLFGIDPSKTG
jgi:predicted TIM-barrel fold metal-dependent hydrolase